MELYHLSTEDSLTFYWCKPADARPGSRYRLLLDGCPLAETGSTHAQALGLAPAAAHTAVLEYCPQPGAPWAELAECAAATAPARPRLDVQAYGAVGDGKTLNTRALQACLDACGPGQTVYFPAGVYRTGALRLHSDMEVYLAEGAVLQGSEDPADYLPRIRSRFEGTELDCYASLLNLGTLDHAAGPNYHDVILRGQGAIIGGGQALARRIMAAERLRLQAYLADHAALVASCENSDTIPGRVRGRLLNLSSCRNVRVTGLRLENGPSWNLHMIYCDHIVTDHCSFRSEGIWNGDGWDPDSSEHCTLFACRFSTGDDAVAIKSGKNPEGNVIARPTRHIRIFDCIGTRGHGIIIGSEMSGGVEDVEIWDCDMGVALSGFEIKTTKKRGGYVRGITLRDCTVARVLIHTVGYNDDGVPAPVPPVLENCTFERVRILGQSLSDEGVLTRAPGIELRGLEPPGHALQNITFRDCTLAPGSEGMLLARCRSLTFAGLCCE